MSEKTASEKLGKPLPQCKAILLCERAIMEAKTNKVSLIGIFDRFTFPKLPARTQVVTAFLRLVDGIGSYMITLEVVDLATGKSLAQGKGLTIEFKDRLAVVQIILQLPPLPLDHEGSFDVIAFADGQEIDRQKFVVACVPPRGNS